MELFYWLLDRRHVLEDAAASLHPDGGGLHTIEGAIAILVVGIICQHGKVQCTEAALRYLSACSAPSSEAEQQYWDVAAVLLAHLGQLQCLRLAHVTPAAFIVCLGVLHGFSEAVFAAPGGPFSKIALMANANTLLPLIQDPNRLDDHGCATIKICAASFSVDSLYTSMRASTAAYNCLSRPLADLREGSQGYMYSENVCGVRLRRRQGGQDRLAQARSMPAFVLTPTVMKNVQRLASALAVGTCSDSAKLPILVCGPAGCGKTSCISWIAEKLGYFQDMVELHLDDAIDSKTLLGTYGCTDTPGVFVWQAGVITQAMSTGRWLVIEDVDRAPFEVLAALISLMETRKIRVPGRGVMHAHPDFRLIGTRVLAGSATRAHVGADAPTGPLAAFVHRWLRVNLEPLPLLSINPAPVAGPDIETDELKMLLRMRHPDIGSQLTGIVLQLYYFCTSPSASDNGAPSATMGLEKFGRSLTQRELFKACARIPVAFAHEDAHLRPTVVLEEHKISILQGCWDVFAGHVWDQPLQRHIMECMAALVGLDVESTVIRLVTHACMPELCSQVGTLHPALRIGRLLLSTLRPVSASLEQALPASFAPTRYSLRLLEKLAWSAFLNEPTLLVGQTGNGKTHIVQALALALGTKLTVINLNIQTDSSDLVGGYKPYNLRQIAVPLVEKLVTLFIARFSQDANSAFLSAIQTALARQDWNRLIKGVRKALQEVVKRCGALAAGTHEWSDLGQDLDDFERRCKQSSATTAASFAFVEGALIRALRNGEWLLLDEINLASPETLRRLAGVLEGHHSTFAVTERGDAEIIVPHANFRVFAAMNPATDVGKRDLPPALRSRFTEIFIHDMDDADDLLVLVRHCLRHIPALDGSLCSSIVDLYRTAREMSAPRTGDLRDGSGGRPHYSVRTLARALTIASDMIAQGFQHKPALSQGFVLAFLVQLDPESFSRLHVVVDSAFGKISHASVGLKTDSVAGAKRRKDGQVPAATGSLALGAGDTFHVPDDSRVVVCNVVIGRGPVPSVDWSKPSDPAVPVKYVRVPSVERHIANVARAVSCRRYPVLLQGPTSSGKTSMVEYLAALCGYPCVRINNHEHTDISEYIGSYVADATGQLAFVDGLLVTALRKGCWIVLDELNLAPSEVLEALNRLLDDNRELFVPETQEVIRPHPHFMLFATQNPPGLYGGRKQLSQAFRNRFIEIHVDDIPEIELEAILEHRSTLPPSFIKCMVNVASELQKLRQKSNIFAGKHGFITTRDLLKWAQRGPQTYQQLAVQGYHLLAERLRSSAERELVLQTLSVCCRCEMAYSMLYEVDSNNIVVDQLQPAPKRARTDDAPPDMKCRSDLLSEPSSYPQHMDEQLVPFLSRLRSRSNERKEVLGTEGLTTITLTASLRRLFVLVNECIANQEPVLLVGDTGCGKTTIIQLLALMLNVPLHIVNCHAHTETADFVGSLRPSRDRVQMEQRALMLLSDLVVLLLKLPDLQADSVEMLARMQDMQSMTSRSMPRENELLTQILLSIPEAEVDMVRPMLLELAACVSRHDAVFEWVDGPLVQAMKNGEFFLLDECSLAEDAVLERLNSVLEPSRMLTLAEKGDCGSSAMDYIVSAKGNFRMFATMNPGGDFGKRELSPALRNRFTEIWVPSVADPADLLQVISEKSLWLCKSYSIGDVVQPRMEYFNRLLVEFMQWFDKHASFGQLSEEEDVDVDAKKVLFVTLRDVHSWLQFTWNVVCGSGGGVEPWSAFVHGSCLVLLDGLGLGTGLNVSSAETIRNAAAEFLLSRAPANERAALSRLFSLDGLDAPPELTNDQQGKPVFGINPFFIPFNQETATLSDFAFSPATTKRNLFRVLRALQISKPILLEGSPGVGKTTLIEALAKCTGHKLVRINLSEQSDLSDLFGQDLPAAAESGQAFMWSDGAFLAAMRAGHWVLLDELNLATQSVLEGLNACLDHRGTAFIPELNQTFPCSPAFRVFASQNPVLQGGGRKGLPKSFLNRFTKVYVEALSVEDQAAIAYHSFPHLNKPLSSVLLHIPECQEHTLQLMLKVHCEVAHEVAVNPSFSRAGGPWDINLRDLFRWIKFLQTAGSQRSTGVTADDWLLYFDIVYARRFRSDFLRNAVLDIVHHVCRCAGLDAKQIFHRDLNKAPLTISYEAIAVGSCTLSRSTSALPDHPFLLDSSLWTVAECFGLCMAANVPILLTGSVGSGKTSLINFLGHAIGAEVRHVSITPATDAADLVGCFEQKNGAAMQESAAAAIKALGVAASHFLLLHEPSFATLEPAVREGLAFLLSPTKLAAENAEVYRDIACSLHSMVAACSFDAALVIEACQRVVDCLDAFSRPCEALGRGRFEWVDGDLVDAMISGAWLVVDNANFCSAAVIDRLNALLEPNGTLLVGESGGCVQGEERRVVPHPDFRIVFTVNPKYGELSRPLRNRCVELHVPDWQPSHDISRIASALPPFLNGNSSAISNMLETVGAPRVSFAQFNLCLTEWLACAAFQALPEECVSRAATLIAPQSAPSCEYVSFPSTTILGPWQHRSLQLTLFARESQAMTDIAAAHSTHPALLASSLNAYILRSLCTGEDLQARFLMTRSLPAYAKSSSVWEGLLPEIQACMHRVARFGRPCCNLMDAAEAISVIVGCAPTNLLLTESEIICYAGVLNLTLSYWRRLVVTTAIGEREAAERTAALPDVGSVCCASLAAVTLVASDASQVRQSMHPLLPDGVLADSLPCEWLLPFLDAVLHVASFFQRLLQVDILDPTAASSMHLHLHVVAKFCPWLSVIREKLSSCPIIARCRSSGKFICADHSSRGRQTREEALNQQSRDLDVLLVGWEEARKLLRVLDTDIRTNANLHAGWRPVLFACAKFHAAAFHCMDNVDDDLFAPIKDQYWKANGHPLVPQDAFVHQIQRSVRSKLRSDTSYNVCTFRGRHDCVDILCLLARSPVSPIPAQLAVRAISALDAVLVREENLVKPPSIPRVDADAELEHFAQHVIRSEDASPDQLSLQRLVALGIDKHFLESEKARSLRVVSTFVNTWCLIKERELHVSLFVWLARNRVSDCSASKFPEKLLQQAARILSVALAASSFSIVSLESLAAIHELLHANSSGELSYTVMCDCMRCFTGQLVLSWNLRCDQSMREIQVADGILDASNAMHSLKNMLTTSMSQVAELQLNAFATSTLASLLVGESNADLPLDDDAEFQMARAIITDLLWPYATCPESRAFVNLVWTSPACCTPQAFGQAFAACADIRFKRLLPQVKDLFPMHTSTQLRALFLHARLSQPLQPIDPRLAKHLKAKLRNELALVLLSEQEALRALRFHNIQGLNAQSSSQTGLQWHRFAESDTKAQSYNALLKECRDFTNSVLMDDVVLSTSTESKHVRSMCSVMLRFCDRLSQQFDAFVDIFTPFVACIVEFASCLTRGSFAAHLKIGHRKGSGFGNNDMYTPTVVDMAAIATQLRSQSMQTARAWMPVMHRWLVEDQVREDDSSNQLPDFIEQEVPSFFSLFEGDATANTLQMPAGIKPCTRPATREVRYLAISGLVSAMFSPSPSRTHMDQQRNFMIRLAETHHVTPMDTTDDAAFWAQGHLSELLRTRRLAASGTDPHDIFSHSLLEHGPAEKVYNFYKDSNVSQASLCVQPIRELGRRIFNLLAVFPANQILVQLVSTCTTTTTLDLGSPLPVFLTGLSMLLQHAQTWEQHAAKAAQLGPSLTAISRLVTHWRKLELSTWAGMLKVVLESSEALACEAWQEFHKSCCTADTLESLHGHCADFMEAASLSQFATRLQLIRVSAMLFARVDKQQHLSPLLGACFDFYVQFRTTIRVSLESLAAPLLKDFEDQVSLHRWDEQTYYSLKESTEKGHAILHKLMQSFKEICSRACKPFILSIYHVPRSALTLRVMEATRPLFRVCDDRFGSIDSRPETDVEMAQSADLTLLAEVTRYRSRMEELISDASCFLSPQIDAGISDMSELVRTTGATFTAALLQLVDEKVAKVIKKKRHVDLYKQLQEQGITGLVASMNVPLCKLPLSGILGAMQLDGFESTEWQALEAPLFVAVDRLHRIQQLVTEGRCHADVTLHEANLGLNQVGHAIDVCVSYRREVFKAASSLFTIQQGKHAPQEVSPQAGAVLEACEVARAKISRLYSFCADLQSCSVPAFDNDMVCLGSISVTTKNVSPSNWDGMSDSLLNLFNQLTTHCDSIRGALNHSDVLADRLGELLSWKSKFLAAEEPSVRLGPCYGFVAGVLRCIEIDQQLLCSSSFVAQPTDNAQCFARLLKQLLLSVQSANRAAACATVAECQQVECDQVNIAILVRDLCAGLQALRIEQIQNMRTNTSAPPTEECVEVLRMQEAWLTRAHQLVGTALQLHEALALATLNVAEYIFQFFTGGYHSPPDASEDEGTGAGDALAEGTGIGEGVGAKDVTSQLTNEEQVLGLQGDKPQDNGENAGDKKDGVEMDHDFEGDLEDVPESGQQSDGENDDGEKSQELDREMGDIDKKDDAENVDSKLWDKPADDTHKQEQGDTIDTDAQENGLRAAEEDDAGELSDSANNEDDALRQDDQHLDDNESMADSAGPSSDVDLEEADQHNVPEDNAEEAVNDQDEAPDVTRDQQADDEIQEPEGVNSQGELPDNKTNQDGDEADSCADAPELTDESMLPRDAYEEGLDGQDDDDDAAESDHEDAHDPLANEPAISHVEDMLQEVHEESRSQAYQDSLPQPHADPNGDSRDITEDTTPQPARDTSHGAAEPSAHQQDVSATEAAGADQSLPEQAASSTRSKAAPSASEHRRLERKLLEIEEELKDIISGQQKTDEETPDGWRKAASANEAGAMQIDDTATEERLIPIADQNAAPPTNESEKSHAGSDTATRDQVAETSEQYQLPDQPAPMSSMLPDLASDGRGHSSAAENSATHAASEGTAAGVHIGDAVLDDSVLEPHSRMDAEELILGAFHEHSSLESAAAAWHTLVMSMSDSSSRLCENLRLILEPTLSAKLGGEFKTGKRINMRRIIPYIASEFRKDKIWMRRSVPSKRTYQVMLAIDDSRSMAPENTGGGIMACEALALISKALARLEVGEISVASFGETLHVIHPFQEPFTDEAGARVLRSFTFGQHVTKTASALEQLVSVLAEAKSLTSNSSNMKLACSQLVFVISDGMVGSGLERLRIRRSIADATSKGQLVVLIIVDRAGSHSEDSILKMQSIAFDGGRVQKTAYMEDYPFPYYVVVQHARQLPDVLSDALRQWFEMQAGQ